MYNTIHETGIKFQEFSYIICQQILHKMRLFVSDNGDHAKILLMTHFLHVLQKKKEFDT